MDTNTVLITLTSQGILKVTQIIQYKFDIVRQINLKYHFGVNFILG